METVEAQKEDVLAAYADEQHRKLQRERDQYIPQSAVKSQISLIFLMAICMNLNSASIGIDINIRAG